MNPVSKYQMHSYYVDGQLSSLLASAVALLILIDRRADRVLMIVLALVVALTINVKLTGALYIAIIGSGYWLWHAATHRTRSIELGLSLLAGGKFGRCPHGIQSLHQSVSEPADQEGQCVLSSFRLAINSQRSGLRTSSRAQGDWRACQPHSWQDRSFTSPPRSGPSCPFTFSLVEIEQCGFPDMRVGGFGPLFSGALVLSIIISALLIWRYRR